jgi:Polysaccharide biosynthesis enzyme WcbI
MKSRDQVVSALRRTVALRDLNASPAWRRVSVGGPASKPIALVYGNCQADALRKTLLTHPGMSGDYHLLRLPAVHEITARELGLIENVLPRVEVLITQEIKRDYRGMHLGTEQLIERIPADATVIRYPVAFFDGIFPYHVYVNVDGSPISTSAPITDYHDLRILHAAEQGWDAARTTRWLEELRIDPQWIREHSEASLAELARRETHMAVQLSDVIRRPENLATSFHTINHPANRLVTEMARQTLAQLGHADADRMLDTRDDYLDSLQAPRERQILRALGIEPRPNEPQVWRTPSGSYPMSEVVRAHLALYSARPKLLAAGLAKHQERLRRASAAWS